MLRLLQVDFDLLTLKVGSILVFLGLCVLDFNRPGVREGRQTSSDRQTSDAHHRLKPPILGAGA